MLGDYRLRRVFHYVRVPIVLTQPDFAAILDDLDFPKKQPARLPTCAEAARITLCGWRLTDRGHRIDAGAVMHDRGCAVQPI